MKKSNTLKAIPNFKESDAESIILARYINEIDKSGNFNFDSIADVKCEIHKEFKENFMISDTKEYKKFSMICSTCLSDLNCLYDDSLKSKLYSSIIKSENDNILKIKDDKIDFEIFYLGKSLQVHTYNDILSLGDDLLNFSKSFETEVIDKVNECKITPEEIERIKTFIISILDSKNQPILKNIGENQELKIRYIKLASFLLNFKGFLNEGKNYDGLTNSLKKHIMDLVQKRTKINNNIKKWLKLILGEMYSHSHELEKLPYDQEFYRSVPIEYVGQEATNEINRLNLIINELRNVIFLNFNILIKLNSLFL